MCVCVCVRQVKVINLYVICDKIGLDKIYFINLMLEHLEDKTNSTTHSPSLDISINNSIYYTFTQFGY